MKLKKQKNVVATLKYLNIWKKCSFVMICNNKLMGMDIVWINCYSVLPYFIGKAFRFENFRYKQYKHFYSVNKKRIFYISIKS